MNLDLLTISNLLTACCTGLLALFTAWLAWMTSLLVKETTHSRKAAEHHQKEIAFRAVLIELADNILSFERWKPTLNAMPDKEWKDHPLQFIHLYELFRTVWIHKQLLERSFAVVMNVKRLETALRELLFDRQELNQNAIDTYYVIDLYLKQLACYVICEAQRQGIDVPAESWVKNANIFQPSPWLYGDSSSGIAARNLETQLIPPLPPEPNEHAFQECALERLISQAHQRLQDQDRDLKKIFRNPE